MRYIYLIIAILSLTLHLSNCKKNSTDPPVNGSVDTTSHDFVWQFDTIGIQQSYLRDVSIISPDDIWAVGEINTEDTGVPDSNGTIIRPYNAVHWNGSEWELHRLKTARFEGSPGEDLITAVYAFSSSDIWMFSDAGSYLYWDGHRWETEFVWERKGGIYTIWGFASDDLYFAGTNGSLTHYDGNSFTLVQTGTTLDIKDIHGAIDPASGKKEILFVASTNIPPPGRVVRKVEGTHSIEINSDSLPNLISTIWFVNNHKYYVGGDGLWSVDQLGLPWKKENDLLPYFKHDMIGNQQNDIFIVGAFGFIAHYNGSSWHNYNENDLQLFDGVFGKVDLKENLIVAVGRSGLKSIILRGYR